MRHSKASKEKNAGPKETTRTQSSLDSETRALIREIMDPYWAWRFARSS